MAKLNITYGPPIPDPRSFQDYTASMTDEERAVLSLRGFACATSMMIPSYHLWLAATGSETTNTILSDYPTFLMRTYMREAMLDLLLVQLRRLYDPDTKSLAGGSIALLLDKPNVCDFLVRRAAALPPSGVTIDPRWVEDHLRLVQARCSLGLVKHASNLRTGAPRIQVQVYLARRATNKRSAHMTLDDYGITQSDLRDICFNTLIIARAIHRIHGKDVYEGRYDEVDTGAYESAARLFDHRHTAGLLSSSLEENIDLLLQKTSTARNRTGEAARTRETR